MHSPDSRSVSWGPGVAFLGLCDLLGAGGELEPELPGLRGTAVFAFHFLAMPSEAKQYRANAEECARRAEKAAVPQVKAAFKEVERQWLEMARLSEEGAW
jgi:hypothetical protein